METQQVVEIDGVPVPATDALAVAQQGIAAATDAQAYVQQALAQPIGQALNDTKSACAAVQKAIRRYTSAVQRAANDAQSPVVDTLANYVRGALDQTAGATSNTATAAATGNKTAAPVPSMANTVAGGAGRVLYIDCAMLCHGIETVGMTLEGTAANGGYVFGLWLPDQGPTIACPAALDCYSKTWQRFDGTLPADWPVWNGLGQDPHVITAADMLALSTFCACAIAGGGGGVPQTWNIYYYCDPCADPNGIHNYQASVFPSNPGGKYILFSGAGINFPSQPVAQAALDSSSALLDSACQYQPGSCPSPPTPAPAPTPAPPSPEQPQDQCIPIPTCDTAQFVPAPEGQHKSPAWYDDDWINHREEIINDLASFGEAALSFLTGATDRVILSPTFRPTSEQDQPTWVQGTILSVASALTAIPQAAIDSFRSLSSSLLGMVQSIAGQFHSCDKQRVAKLCTGRALIHFLTHFDPLEVVHLNINIEPLDRYFEYAINAACFNVAPDLGEIWNSFKRGYTTREQFLAVAAAHGLAIVDEDDTPTALWGAYLAESEWIKPEEYIQWARRQDPPIEDAQISLDLQQRYGFQVTDQADKRVFLYDELPNISDVLHFLQRNVFDQQYVADYGLMEGYEERFVPRYYSVLRAQGMMDQTIQDHYAAHWINPSIGQLAEMAQRLRPGRVDPRIAFKWQDFLRVLAEQDVAPYFRERLQAISFRTLPIRQLTQLVVTRQITEDELAQRWQDIGYSPADSKLLARALMIQGARQRAIQMRGYTPAVVAKLWPPGKISYADAIANLAPLGLDKSDVDTLLEVSEREAQAALYQKNTLASIREYASLATKAYADGVVSASDAQAALTKAGFSPEAASVEIQTTTLRVKMTRIDQARNAIRRSFLRGEVNASEAESALALIGVQPDSIAASISLWQMQLTIPRKAAATGQIRKWAEEGLISLAAAETRFNNLGWRPEDITLMIAEINQTIKSAELRAQQRTDKALAQASARAAAAQLQIQKAYCRKYSPSKLKLWFSERIIDESGIASKLQQCGYDSEYIRNFIDEATVARDKKDEQSAKKGPAGIEYTGPGAITS